MKIALIVLAFLIALIGWFKPKTVSKPITISMVLLLVAAFIFQIVVELREQKEKAKSLYTGVLKHDRVLLSGSQKIYPKFEFGDSGAILVYAGPQGGPIFKIFDDNSLTIMTEDDQLKVSTIIRDHNGHVVAELSKNEWKVNKNNSFDRNYGKALSKLRITLGMFSFKFVLSKIAFNFKVSSTIRTVMVLP